MKASEKHELQHQKYDHNRIDTYGDHTDKYMEVYNSPADWVEDDYQAYGAQISFYQAVLGELNKICCD